MAERRAKVRAVLLIGEEGSLAWLQRALAEEGYAARLHRPAWREGGWQGALYRAREEYCRLLSAHDGAFLLGQSAGAAMALVLAQRHPAWGVACLSAPYCLSARARLGLCEGGLGRKWALGGLLRAAREGMYSVECPILAAQSASDRCLARTSAQRLLSASGAQDRRLVFLRESGHLLTDGPERALLLSALMAFFRDNS